MVVVVDSLPRVYFGIDLGTQGPFWEPITEIKPGPIKTRPIAWVGSDLVFSQLSVFDYGSYQKPNRFLTMVPTKNR